MNQEIDLAKAKLYLIHLQLAVTEFENANGVKIKRERRADGTFGSGAVKSIEKAINDGIDFVKKEAEEIEDRIKSFLGLDRGVMVQNLLKNPENVEILKELNIDPGKLLESANKQKNGIPDKAKIKELQSRLKELTPEKILNETIYRGDKQLAGSQSFDEQVLVYGTIYHELITEKYDAENQIKTAKGAGYSLERRTKEMVDLYKKEGKDSREVQWRNFIVKAELDFGSDLDKIKSSKSNSKEIDEGYQVLLKKMEQSQGSININKRKTDNDIDNKMVDEAVEIMSNLGKIIGTNLNVIIKSDPLDPQNVGIIPGIFGKDVAGLLSLGTATGIREIEDDAKHSSPRIEEGRTEGDFKHKSGVFNRENDFDKMLVWHEIGHLYEVTADLGRTTAKFISQREKESLLAPEFGGLSKIKERIMNRREGINEVKRQEKKPVHLEYLVPGINIAIDDFYMDYAGATYPDTADRLTSTELVSTGFECLSDPEMLKRVSTKDREHILYTIGSIMYGGK